MTDRTNEINVLYTMAEGLMLFQDDEEDYKGQLSYEIEVMGIKGDLSLLILFTTCSPKQVQSYLIDGVTEENWTAGAYIAPALESLKQVI